MQTKLRVCLLLLSLLAGEVSAQTSVSDSAVCEKNDCYCENDLTPAGIMISHVHEKGQWMLSYRYMSMGMNGMLSGTDEMDKNDVLTNYLMTASNMRMHMHMLMGMYGITDRLTVMAMLNYNVYTMNMDMLETEAMAGMPGMNMGSMNTSSIMKTSGLGDVKLHALYGLIKTRNHQLLIGAGVSLPVGSIGLKGKSDDMLYPGKRLPYMMQLGSGTVDILPCLSYLYRKQNLAFSIQGSGIIRPGYNSVGYRLGSEATVNSWVAYEWFNLVSTSLRLEGAMAGKIEGYDPTLYYYNEPGANPYNYGGKRLNGFIGAACRFKKGFIKNNRLGIEYGIPLYQNLNGTQMQLKHTLYASWGLTF